MRMTSGWELSRYPANRSGQMLNICTSREQEIGNAVSQPIVDSPLSVASFLLLKEIETGRNLKTAASRNQL